LPKEERKVGLIDGKFYPCPEKKVCISTQAPENDEDHYIKPILYKDSKKEAMERVIKAVNSKKRTKILEQTEDYIHFLFVTGLFKFEDDVEFFFDDLNKIIHFRSQSRIGGFDWGTNRRRMESIRKLYKKNK